MDDEAVIAVDNVSKNFRLPQEKHGTVKAAFTSLFRGHNRQIQTQHALRNISFEIKKGEFFGIVGRNGSGKSTLLKMLAGIYQPTVGKVTIHGKLVPFIELGVGFNPELTGRENVYLNGALLGFSKKEIDGMYKSIVEFAELERFMDQKLKNYSSGMQVRLAFSMAVRAQADILLIDEVLAVGDADFQRKCFEYFRDLKKEKKTVVFVTHDMNAVIEYCSRALLIQDAVVTDIGAPKKIAAKYRQMFMEEEAQPAEETETNKDSEKRWGTRAAEYMQPRATITPEKLTVTAEIVAKRDLDDIYFGVHVVSQDGLEVTAMNNRMIGEPDIKNLRKGEAVTLEWAMMNIFNDGKYTVGLTMVDDAVGVLDWFSGACKFTVKRPQRSTTNVFPPTTLIVRKAK